MDTTNFSNDQENKYFKFDTLYIKLHSQGIGLGGSLMINNVGVVQIINYVLIVSCSCKPDYN